MAGPLDFLTSDDAQMGLAMLAAAGPTATPMSFGQRLAGGMQQAQAQSQAREDRKLKALLMQAQVAQANAEVSKTQGLLGALGRLHAGDGGAAPAAPAGLLGPAGPPQAGLLGPAAPSGAAPIGGGMAPGGGGQMGGGAAPAAQGRAPGSLRGVPIGAINDIRLYGGPDMTKQWELENIGTPMQPGWVRMADGTERYLADPTKGRTVDAQGNVGLMPGYLPSLAAETAVTKGIEAQEAARLAEGTPVYDTDPNSPTYGKKIIKSRLDMLGGGQGGPASASAPAAPARNLLSPGGYAGGSSSAAADGQRQTLLAELPKAQQEVAKAQQSGDAAAAARAQADIAAIQKELARLPGGARAAPVNLLTPTPARAPANVVELSPAEQATNKANEAAATSLAGGTAKTMETSADKANAAVQAVSSAQRLQRAIDSDKAFVGTGATLRMKGAQIASLLGVQGKNDEERIANTRVAMQEMAKLTLAGRSQMQGQGQITDRESALAERASSGSIEDFTPAEIKMLAGASERSARWQHQQHQNKLAALAKNPAAASQLGIYATDPLPPPLAGNRMDPFAPAAPPLPTGWTVKVK